MRKTILTTAALFGVAPAALAATGPLPSVVPPGNPGPATTEPAQLDSAKTHRRLHTNRRSTRAKRAGSPTPAASPQLEAIAQCESGGDPKAVGGGGQFRGKYQFTYATWAAVGGSGDPASAPEGEQDKRAAQLLASSGTGQWPVCG